MKKVAVLVDGGFYRKVAKHLWGDKTPEERVDELIRYCRLHLKDRDFYTKKSIHRLFRKINFFLILRNIIRLDFNQKTEEKNN